MAFSQTCGGFAPSLRKAANLLLGLSDFIEAATVASDLIKLEPLYDNGYYLRALAQDGGGLAEKAIDDYVTTIELVGNKDSISSTSTWRVSTKRWADFVMPCCPFTGATFVSLKNTFAQKTGLEIDRESIVRLGTANGSNDPTAFTYGQGCTCRRPLKNTIGPSRKMLSLLRASTRHHPPPPFFRLCRFPQRKNGRGAFPVPD